MENQNQKEIDPAESWTVRTDKGGYFRKDGPYHRGQLDAFHGRPRSPHHLMRGARIGPVSMSKEQRDQYHAGFNDRLMDDREGARV